MSCIPKCGCGIDSANREILSGRNRGRWYWKCAKNLCGYFKINDPGETTYTFTTYTIPSKPKRHPPTRSSFSSKQIRRPGVLDLDSSTNLSALGSGNDKQSRSRRQNERIIVQLALYTNTDISVHAEGRHNYLQTIFNTVIGVAWLDDLQLWVFSADQQTYKQVWELLQQHRALFDITGIPVVILRWLPKSAQQLLDQLQQDQSTYNDGSNKNDTLDDLLYDWDFEPGYGNDYESQTCSDYTHQNGEMVTGWNLEEHIGVSTLWEAMTVEQQAGFKKTIEKDGHVYLQDPGGSGNSLQALAVALAHRKDWPVLIICRASVCQKWTTLIQDMLRVDRHQVTILDHVPTPVSPKSAQSRRRRKREKLKKQKETVAAVSTSSHSSHSANLEPSTHSNNTSMTPKGKAKSRNHDRRKGDCWIRIVDNSGDARPDNTITNNDQQTDHLTHANQNSLKKKRKLKKGDVYIRLIDNSGDYYSDAEATISNDDDFMDSNDSDTEKCTFKTNMETNSDGNTSTLNGTGQIGNNDNNTHLTNQMTSGETHFLIMSYDKAITDLGTPSVKECKVIIFDDCHDLNGTLLPAQKSSLQDIVNASKKTIMMSDVPILLKPMESFLLLQILKPSMFVDKKFFGQRYCGAKQIVFGWDYTGSSNSFELEYLLHKTVLVG